MEDENNGILFRNFCRISKGNFYTFLRLIESNITKQVTNIYEGIPAEINLAIKLGFRSFIALQTTHFWDVTSGFKGYNRSLTEICKGNGFNIIDFYLYTFILYLEFTSVGKFTK